MCGWVNFLFCFVLFFGPNIIFQGGPKNCGWVNIFLMYIFFLNCSFRGFKKGLELIM